VSSGNPETRVQILQAALRLLEQGGGATVRLSDIAKEAGVSRQALYLHFANRGDLLVAVTRYVDEVKGIDARLAESRAAANGLQRLDAYVAAWAGYIPEIHGTARALMAMQDTDAEARAAWEGRMAAVRDGFAAAVAALERDGKLRKGLGAEAATDLLGAMVTVQNWEDLVRARGWPQARYVAEMQRLARAAVTD